jgi:hypothetical protein
MPMDILDMKLTKDGFKLTFTKRVGRKSAEKLSAYPFLHYYYNYHAEYGSDKVDVTPAKVTSVKVSRMGLPLGSP